MEKTVLSYNTILQGRYRVLQLLGHGGMGAVYLAMDENLKCRVTIKETFATADERELRRAFEREACLLANIRHQAFPKVTDYFEYGDGLFFVMDYIDGEDLAKALKIRDRPFPVASVLGWADSLLAALAELHAFHPPIVHKDIKPANIKLSPKGEIFLLDFGLAKGAAGQMSTVPSRNYSHLHGHTPHFAPPEQIAGTGTNPRSDLYSLAATLWCLLTGEVPPDASQRNDALNNGQPDPLRPASALNPEVTPAVAAVLTRAMSLNRALRPADAAEMREALREAVEAPRRAAAAREREEADERLRLEGERAGREAAEAEAAKLLDAERAAHAAELQRVTEEHDAMLTGARQEAERLGSELAQAKAELERLEKTVSADEADIQLLANKVSVAEQKLDAETKARAEAEAALLRLRHEMSQLTRRNREALEELEQFRRLLSKRKAERESARREAAQIFKELEATRALAHQLSEEKDVKLAEGPNIYRRRDIVLASAASAALAMLLVGAIGLLAAMWRNEASGAVPSESGLRVNANGVDVDMVRIAGRTFTMGSPESEPNREVSEGPQHKVNVPAFNIGRYEITQAQWRAVARLPKVSLDLPEDPSYFKGGDLPVENVSWHEATEFCARLSKATGRTFRLPTEAEWEYAARADAAGGYPLDLSLFAWYADNSGKQRIDSTALWDSDDGKGSYRNKLAENGCQTRLVGQKQANAFGLYDTLGNVWEWCLDNWHDNYNGAPADGSGWV
ncbi:MAG TPA: SUMF1/EgtB/PvdO family nonheme iron enzyme, partial [Pyrinomonadaceae bacterium]|nr:SUMF1/EgtB/PvdO family nonheme iron enzyme [Pyrinomonadaceae bacterium]